jgi:uncharacterized repeat protein (TIGR04076 family)
MTKVKIEVIKRFSPEDVFGVNHNQRTLSGKPITVCNKLREGDEFIVDDIEAIPEGFCGWAWRDIYKDLSVLFFDGNFYRPEKGVAYVSCTDGRKPVVFKLTRADNGIE